MRKLSNERRSRQERAGKAREYTTRESLDNRSRHILLRPRSTGRMSIIKHSRRILYIMECHITPPPPPSTNVLQKLVTIPSYTLSTVTGTSTHRGSPTKKYYRPGTQPHTIYPRIICTDQIYYIVISKYTKEPEKPGH